MAIKSVKILPGAQSHIASLQVLQDTQAKALLQDAITDIAATDGDRVLDSFEAEALKEAFDSVIGTLAPDATLTDAQVGELKSALSTRIGELKSERVSSTEVLFTSEGEALTVFRSKIMGSIHDTITKADGRDVSVNMMLFAFTDKVMADEIIQIAKDNPNVTFRLLTDWSQLATSGGRQAPRLAKIAAEDGITNLQVQFKKDEPYIWSNTAGRPVFSHGHVKGLNHHKGFVTTIDGRPEKMTFGSFNWSVSAMKSNYENMMMLDRKDPDNRRIMKGYDAEFSAFWNNDDAALDMTAAKHEKNRIYEEMYAAHGKPFSPYNVPDLDTTAPEYEPKSDADSGAIDVNSFMNSDSGQLQAICGKTLAGKIQKELRDYGRFDSWTEVLVRVPALASASAWVREQLMEDMEFGDGGLSINSATVEELDRAGLSRRQAERVVAFRDSHGAFESLDELDDISGIGKSTIARISQVMTDDDIVAAYSARVPGEAATTGYAESNRGTLAVPVNPNDGSAAAGDVTPANRAELETLNNDLSAQVVDMLRRAKPGQTVRLAMYGLSTSSPEYKALERAIARGIEVKVVIYKAYNAGAINALDKLKEEGFPVDVRVIKSRVMHEKFGVVGDDVFNGSANMSSSSITKHSEDRFMFRNVPDVADRFVEEFARLWEKGYAPS